jgi:hypothetical protein
MTNNIRFLVGRYGNACFNAGLHDDSQEQHACEILEKEARAQLMAALCELIGEGGCNK